MSFSYTPHITTPRGWSAHLMASALCIAAALTWTSSAWAKDTVKGTQDAPQAKAIRASLAKQLPNLPAIDSVLATPMAGLFEVRFGGSDILYTDAAGDFLIQGSLIDLKAKRNITEARVTELSAIAFDELPLKDAFVIKRGTGARKIAVFEDPNCSYCKRFEQGLATLDNITVYVFLYPILGADSVKKSQAIWCAKNPGKAFEDWMLDGVQPDTSKAASCNTDALTRNTAFGQRNKIQGTPAIFFADGSRVPGAISPEEVEKRLAAIQ